MVDIHLHTILSCQDGDTNFFCELLCDLPWFAFHHPHPEMSQDGESWFVLIDDEFCLRQTEMFYGAFVFEHNNVYDEDIAGEVGG